MASAKKPRRAKSGPKRARAPAARAPVENGNAVGGALLALEEGREPERDGDASVEAPLPDWLEPEDEPDRWLDERPGQDTQKVPDE